MRLGGKSSNRKSKRKKQRTQKKSITKKVHFNLENMHDSNVKSVPEAQTFDKMNCSPVAKNNRVVEDSCFTPDALEEIKNAYNRNRGGNDIIVSSKPTQIWSELRQRLKQCTTEDCWLEEIKNDEIRRKLDKTLFAPDRPSEWEQNPVSWLSNYDIAAVLRQYEDSNPEFKLLGPSAIDYDTKLGDNKCVWDDLCNLSLEKLTNSGKRKLGVVFNLDKHYQGGSHWVSMFVDLDKQTIFYYDSAVNPVPREVSRLKREIIQQGKQLTPPINFHYIQNDYSHQTTNTECGMYSLFFIITWLTQKVHSAVLNKSQDEMIGGKRIKISFEELIKMFTKPGINDQMMIRFRNKFFNKK